MNYHHHSRNYSCFNNIHNYKYSILNLLFYNKPIKFRKKILEEKYESFLKNADLLNSFHTNVLTKKYNLVTKPKLLSNKPLSFSVSHSKNNNSNIFYLTKVENNNNTNSSNYYSNTLSTTETHKKYKKLLNIKDYNNHHIHTISSYTANSHRNNNSNYFLKKYLKFNARISECLNANSNLKVHNNLNNFLLSSREIRKEKLFKKIQTEKLNEKLEDNNNEKEKLNNRIIKLNNLKIYFNIFYEFFSQYIIYLYHYIDKEKTKDLKLLEYKYTLENINIKLENKINQLEKLLNLYKQYKIFLIKIKFKVNNLKEIPYEKLLYYGINLKKKTIHRNSLFDNTNQITHDLNNNQKNINNEKKFFISRKKSVMTNTNLAIKKLKAKGYILLNNNPKIFDSVEEFYSQLKFIEGNIIELFKTFDDNVEIKKNLDKNLNDIKELNIENEKHINNQINLLKNKLEINKFKNSKLLEKYNYLKNDNLSNKHSSQLILKKIIKFLLSLPINIENDFNLTNFYLNIKSKNEYIINFGKKINKLSYILKLYERLLIYYINLSHYYKNNNKTKYKFELVYKEIEKEKRYKKSKLNQLNAFKNRLNNTYKFNKKNDNLLFLPIKKIDIYEKLIAKQKAQKNKKDKLIKTSQNENDYINWIKY